MLVCDTHADTLYALSAPDRPAGGPLDVTAELLTAGGGVRVQCLALFVCTNGMRMSPTIVERELQAFEGLKQRGFCQITELSQAREGVANAMLTIEGGEAFGGDAAQVDRFADLGVRMAALVWNNENGVAHPALSGSGEGLTPLGWDIVSRMRRPPHGSGCVPPERARLLRPAGRQGPAPGLAQLCPRPVRSSAQPERPSAALPV